MIALHSEAAPSVTFPPSRQQFPVIRIADTRLPGISPFSSAAALRATGGLALLDVTPSGAIEFATGKALSLLGKYFPSPSQLFPQRLPEPLLYWLRQRSQLEHSRWSSALSGQESEELRIYVTGCEEGNFQLLLDERSDVRMVERLATLSLTRKEAEVLLWISRGKTDGDIATIFGCSTRTVNKHSEQIRSKLGVETRTAAAAVALELISPCHGT